MGLGSAKNERIVKIVWNLVGTVFVGLGVMGVFLPLLPTTPFLLAAAACYARGSKKFYLWLMNNRVFGRYIRNYKEGKGIQFNIKVLSITILWIAIAVSTLSINVVIVKLILFIIAILVTIHIIRLPTARKEDQ